MTKFADLHIHTHYSDSTLSPEEVVEGAIRAELACIAISDHDTLDGIEPARKAAKASGLEVIPAIELSSEMHNKDIHILGYFIDGQSAALQEELFKIQQARMERIKNMILKLKSQGIGNIEFEEVSRLTKSNAIGRVHLASVLKEKGWIGSISEAFEKYIGEGCPAYVGKFKLTSHEAIALIKKSGGLSVLAHPMITNKDELIPSFVESGLDGIEVYYPNYSDVTMRYYEGLAKKHNLLLTGGSDAHGKAKQNTFIGKARIPYELVLKMKERLARHA